MFTVLDVGTSHRTETVGAFRRFDDHDLSLTDASTIALCEAYGVDSVLSFDDDFDGLVDRTAPGDSDE